MGGFRVTVESVRGAFCQEGYHLLDQVYPGNKGRLTYTCSEGHQESTTWSRFKQGHRCPSCAGLKKKTVAEVRAVFLAAGYELLSDSYTSAHSQDLRYRCPAGHYGTTSWNYFQRGYKCPACFKNERHTVEEAVETFKDRGYLLLSETYTTNKEKLLVSCPQGHLTNIRFDSFVAGRGCGECSKSSHTSSAEEEISSFIVSKLGGDGSLVLRNDRNLIKPQEVDIFVPSRNFAIEYCGLHWHSEVSGKKPSNYHYGKMVACAEKGVRLMTIFEDEFRNRGEVVLSRIQNAIGTPDVRIYARDTTFGVVQKPVSDRFLEAHHLQGNSLSKYRFGLFDAGFNLVALMTFGAVARAHTNKNIPGRTIEMKRMATLPGYSVIGGASKLFKHALSILKDEGYNNIKSYCDMRYGSITPVYEKLGFELKTFTKYTPHYIKGDKRVRNQGLCKTPEDRLTGKTEWELRREQGYDRIFDCGHRTYLYKIPATGLGF